MLGYAGRLARAGDYISGQLLPGSPFLACRDQHGQLRAFHNVRQPALLCESAYSLAGQAQCCRATFPLRPSAQRAALDGCPSLAAGAAAFRQVCRHHAAAVAAGGGSTAGFRCPYHGWEYALDGRLQRAVGLRGIQNFRASDHGLVPLPAATLGPWLFGRLSGGDAG